MTTNVELNYVKDLARKYMEMASGEEMNMRRKRWRDLYSLKKPDRPPIVCLDADWGQVTQEDMVCTDSVYRSLEATFKSRLCVFGMGDDTVFYPYIVVRHPWDRNILYWSAMWNWGVDFPGNQCKETGSVSLFIDPPIKDEKDLAKIHVPDAVEAIRLEKQELTEQKRVYDDIFQGIIPVRIVFTYCPVLGHLASLMMGLETLMIKMAQEPDFVHALMNILQKAELQFLDQFDQARSWTGESNCHGNGPNMFPESVKTTPADVPWQASDLWGRTESQEFQLASPAMTDEFLVTYQKPIMERFKYTEYGCCEDLTRKLDAVMKISNLRAIVNSPWTDLKTMADKCRDQYVIVWRQPFSEIMSAKDDHDIRADVERGLKITRGCFRSVFCRDVNWNEVDNPPHRIRMWIREAKRAAEMYSD
ncbi:MAG: hypothetical protein ACLQVA_01205 [Candidatus Brocadiia bacterium]